MRAFLIKCVFFMILLLFIVFGGGYDYGIGVSGEKSDYMGAIVEKHKRLKSIAGRKIIFAGGSNLALGLNSARIQDSLQVPVVNLALNAGLGLDFILNELRYTIQPGDEVVLSIEYFLTDHCSYELFTNTISYFPEASRYAKMPKQSILDHLKHTLDKKIEKVKSNKNYLTGLFKDTVPHHSFAYKRGAFNQFGDCEGHFGIARLPYLADGGIIEYSHWNNIDRLNSFYGFAKSKHVKVYFTYPSYPMSQYLLNIETIKHLDRDLHKELLFPVLGGPADFVFDDNLFFDTVYHLSKEGREKRTEKVIQLLKKRQG